MKKHIFVLFILILGVSVLFACRKNDVLSYSEKEKKEIDAVIQKNQNIDSLSVLLDRFKKEKNLYGQVAVYEKTGKIYRENASFENAIRCHENSLEIASLMNDTLEIIEALNNMGTNYRRLGILADASEYHFKALNLIERMGESTYAIKKSRLVALNGIGNIYLTLGNKEAAEKIFRQSLAGEKELNSALGQAINTANIGSIFEDRGQYDSAYVYYQQSLFFNRLAKSDLGVSLCYNHFGHLHENKGELEEALVNYHKAYDIMKEKSDRWHWLESCISMTRVLLLQNKTAQAQTYLEQARCTAQTIHSLEHLSAIHKLDYLYFKKKNDCKRALENYIRSHIYADSVNNKENINHIQNLRVNHEREKSFQEMNIVRQNYMEEQRNKRIILVVSLLALLMTCSVIMFLWYALQMRSKTNRALRQMEQMRTSFFTNITHEFRTPLTVDCYREYAGSHDINLQFIPESNSIEMDFIPEYFNKIMRNLLSNALKYTPTNGVIRVEMEKDESLLILQVFNTGNEIPEEDISRIFETFYQGSNNDKQIGTGIGLPFIRQIVESMNGNIVVGNKKGEGVVFTVRLPLNQITVNSLPWEEGIAAAELFTEKKEKEVGRTEMDCIEDNLRPSILIVEDNPDISFYISTLLKNKYNLYYASNGKEGIDKAKSCMPDLILTDLMMSGMDGYVLCHEIRQSEILNHIPIIIITAKSDATDRIHGLKEGADAFLLKPFNADELLVRVEKLLEQRRLLRNKYSKALQEGSEQNVELTPGNRDFLNRLTAIIHCHLSNKELNADLIADKVCMSRTQLNRKVRAITDCTATTYILRIRMEKAKRLLSSTEQSIGDIAMACGFEDTSYFARVFKQMFDFTPTQFRKTPRS